MDEQDYEAHPTNGQSINASNSSGFIHNPNGPVHQYYGQVTITAQQSKDHKPPYLIPAIPITEKYVPREEPQEKLRNILSQPSSTLTNIYGHSGVGKTTVAAYIAQEMRNQFPDGVLWESVETYQEPNDLLFRFIGSLNPDWFQTALRSQKRLRDIFWGLVENKRMLIVLDNVTYQSSLTALLPVTHVLPAGIHMIVISYNKISHLDHNLNYIPLHGFDRVDDIEKLLNPLLGEPYVRLHKNTLLDIARYVDNNPLELLSIGHELVNRNSTPERFLRNLVNNDGNHSKASGGRGIELSINDMDEELRNLFTILGAFGSSHWPTEALAAAHLSRLGSVQTSLQELCNRGIVQQHVDERFYLNLQSRQIARRLFEQHDRYYRDATFTCLARYYLDSAQDTMQSLLARPDLQSYSGQAAHRHHESFVCAFREAILPNLPHLRRVFEWAQEREDWGLLRRFSEVAYTVLIKYLTISGLESRFPLMMACLVEPLVAPRGDKQRVRFQTMIGTVEWSCENTNDVPATQETANHQEIYSDALPSSRHLPEISLSITVGLVIDGIFEQTRLLDSHWIGVQAVGLILHECTLIGVRFIGCDLRQATWIGGVAQQCDLTGSLLDYALIRKVELYRAVLKDVRLCGAVFEHSQLRGADLQGADLTGAILEDVDLRNADLRGAKLTMANLKGVRLEGACLEGVQWTGANIDETCRFSDQLARSEAEKNARSQATQPPILYRRPRELQSFKNEEKYDFPLADLRALNIKGIERKGINLIGADLRCITLSQSTMLKANLEQANLRSAHLKNILLDGANLHGADLRSVRFEKVSLNQAILTQALIRSSDLQHTKLAEASLIGANLRSSDLSHADLSGTILIDADLRQARLHYSNLEKANLTSADLTSADLFQARLQGANFTNAILTNTNFRDAEVSFEQLAKAAWREGLQLDDLTVYVHNEQVDDPNGIDVQLQLQLAHLSGEYTAVDLCERNLFGADLSGRFRKCKINAAKLHHAQLSGRFFSSFFQDCNLNDATISGHATRTIFDGALLQGTLITGVLTNCSFQHSDLTGAILTNAILVGCNFSGCVGLDETQLRQANRLRGVILPNGERYLGQFECPGDLEDAKGFNIPPEEMIEYFYLPDKVQSRSAC